MKVVTGEKQKRLTLRDLQGLSFFKQNYSVETEEDYAGELRKMNLTDMQIHAAKCNVMPSGERKRLEKNLIVAFRSAKMAFDMANRGISRGSVIDSGISTEKRERALEQGKRFR